MNRRRFLAASTVGAAVTVAGCTSDLLSADSSSNSDDDSDADPSGTTGAAPETGSGRGIEVSASGEIETEPDLAVASIGVEASGDSADEVSGELAERADALRETFDDLGISDDAIEDGRYRVHPVRGDGSGFEGSHSFRVEVEDVERVGEVIDASVDAGANDVGQVEFTLRDETRAELRNEAVDAALENADAEAAHIATNRAVELNGIRSVSTSNADVVPVRSDGAEYESDDAAGGAETTIDSEPVTVRASAEVVYGFEDAN
ncbi:SIMPL domain-containing protein [Natrialbaceae archaeon GCM10025810]|uniref:SIMPL domain-containing protein n=1 Tax=Halovalidus salilacus TaxID=3075124 RepID=UPI003609BB76